MNNLECVMNILAAHREARMWTDEAVARDVMVQLGLDAEGEAAHATPVIMPGITEDEVKAHEAAAKEATDKAEAARAAFEAQKEPMVQARPAFDPNAFEAQRRADEEAIRLHTEAEAQAKRDAAAREHAAQVAEEAKAEAAKAEAAKAEAAKAEAAKAAQADGN